MQIEVSKMTKEEAEKADRMLVGFAEEFALEVGKLALEMKEREGWAALGFKSWRDYCTNINQRMSKMYLERAATTTLVERSLGERVPINHAMQLARIEEPEAMREVYDKVTHDFPIPNETNFRAYVVQYLLDHNKDEQTEDQKTRWSPLDLDEDSELAEAFDKIEGIFGHADRLAMQQGALGWKRKDIVGLARFHESKMRELHYLIYETHWDLARCLKFINKHPDDDTTVGQLKNKCIGTIGFYLPFSDGGFDFTVRACQALAKKIKG